MKKFYKEMYAPKKKPQIINCVSQNVIFIEGEGNPNTSDLFPKHIEALYKISYAFRMSYKKTPIEGYETYSVAPLEGLWTTIDDTIYNGDKDNLKYRLLIVQPNFVTEEVFKDYQEKLKIENPYIADIKYEVLNEGLVGQILHVGPFDTEDVSIDILREYVNENGYELIGKTHHEIYIGDFRKSPPEKLKTIIRYELKKVKKF